MAIAPRKPKELVSLMVNDMHLRREMHTTVVELDKMLKQELTEILQNFLKEQQVDLRLLSHGEVTAAIKQYYKETKIAGEFITLS